MKKIDESSIILRFSDDDKVIHDVGLDSILEGGFPIDTESGNDMEYLGVYLLPDNSSSNGGTRPAMQNNLNLPDKPGAPIGLPPVICSACRGEGLRFADDAQQPEWVCDTCGGSGINDKVPPCLECGAMTPEEAETRCVCSGDKDHCHGCDLWQNVERRHGPDA